MRSFSKKLAFVLAAAMVLTGFAPAAQAKAADDFSLNRTSYILYTSTESVNHHGSETLADGLYGNVEEFDFNLKNKPADWKDAYSYKWASSKEDVATVASGGIVTAKSVGKTVISCTITEKATGNVAATLKADVQVKANAADLEIEAADGEEYDGAEVAPGTKIDFNRTMADQDGNWSNIKGKYVTDETRWVVTPADKGVTVDQSNGVVTVGDDADGEYTVYAETYQSSKYTATTATSNKVTFTVSGEKEIDDVVQKTVKKFVIEFTSPVEKLTNSDVSVTRLLDLKTGVYRYPEKVKSVVTSKDGMSAEVEIFGDLLDKQNYEIAVTGFEAYPKTMTVGLPTRMEVYAKTAELTGNEQVLYTNEPGTLSVRFFNAEDVDITTEEMVAKAYYRLETRAVDGSFYIGSNKLTIKKEGVNPPPVVIAEYSFMNGKELKKLTATNEFIAIKPQAVVVDNVSKWNVSGNWDQPSTTMRKSTTPKLDVCFLKSDGKTEIKTYHDQQIENNNFKVTITAMTPDIAVIMPNGTIKAFKTGTALFYVNLHSKNSNGQFDEGTPYKVIDITVEKDAEFSYVKLGDDEQAITIGTADEFCTKDITLTSYDDYNKEMNFVVPAGKLDKEVVVIECTMDGYQKNAFDSAFAVDIEGAKAKITVDAQALKEGFANDHKPTAGTCAMAYFDIKYNNKVTSLVVTVQEPSYKVENDTVIYEGNYLNIEASAKYVDASRYVTATDNNDNTEKLKEVTFNVYELNNTVKVGKLEFGEYPANGDAKAVTTGAYVFQVLRNGKAYAADFNKATGTVTVAFSTTADLNNAALTGKTVSYKDMGEGTYEFVLYKCYGEGDERTLVQEMAETVVVGASSIGSYNREGDIVDNDVTIATEEYSSSAAAEILKCFVIKDKEGNAVVDSNGVIKKDKYFVDYEAPLKSGYVYVKKITFYEAVADGVYVPYEVEIDTILLNTVK